ncbi:hypothetical protein [Bradyrhizobium sp.]|uniref:hypothetical protein n=1 Tax=Bradyrhizobium sp. TaxID=376 RepID=UPI003C447F8D
MAADSNSKVAWHRAQIRKHRAALKRIETAKFTVGESADTRAVARTRTLVAQLNQKIKQSEHVIAQHERQTRRPLATDLRSLSSVPWSNWNAHGTGPR